nr:hypothetical protein Iba_chr01cCG17600 [Ipomoea batatas]
MIFHPPRPPADADSAYATTSTRPGSLTRNMGSRSSSAAGIILLPGSRSSPPHPYYCMKLHGLPYIGISDPQIKKLQTLAPHTTEGVEELVLDETLTIFCKFNRIPSPAHEVSTFDTWEILSFRSLEEVSMLWTSNSIDTEVSITFSPRMLRALLFSSEYDECVIARRSNPTFSNV